VTNVKLCNFAQVDQRWWRIFGSMLGSAPPAPLKTAFLTFLIAVVVALLVASNSLA
jgi:hypothetical protein